MEVGVVVEIGFFLSKGRQSLPAHASTVSPQKKLVCLILFVVGFSTIRFGSSEGFVLPRIVSSVPPLITAPAISADLLKVRGSTNLILWPTQSAVHTRHLVCRSGQSGRREQPYQLVSNDSPRLQLSSRGSSRVNRRSLLSVEFKYTEHVQGFNSCCKRALKGASTATENVAEPQLVPRIFTLSHPGAGRLAAITNRRQAKQSVDSGTSLAWFADQGGVLSGGDAFSGCGFCTGSSRRDWGLDGRI